MIDRLLKFEEEVIIYRGKHPNYWEHVELIVEHKNITSVTTCSKTNTQKNVFSPHYTLSTRHFTQFDVMVLKYLVRNKVRYL